MKRTLSLLCIGLSGVLVYSGSAQETKDEVKLQVVKYDGVKDAVLKNRGKVVLVDFWGNF